jgi:hypothetical protein
MVLNVPIKRPSGLCFDASFNVGDVVSLGSVGCIASLIDVGCVASWVVGAIRESPLRSVSVTSPRGVSVKTKIPCR